MILKFVKFDCEYSNDDELDIITDDIHESIHHVLETHNVPIISSYTTAYIYPLIRNTIIVWVNMKSGKHITQHMIQAIEQTANIKQIRHSD